MVRQRGTCGAPSVVGATQWVAPIFLWGRMGARRRGNHRGLPLRFAVNHHR
jgi:hypothetical protein